MALGSFAETKSPRRAGTKPRMNSQGAPSSLSPTKAEQPDGHYTGLKVDG